MALAVITSVVLTSPAAPSGPRANYILTWAPALAQPVNMPEPTQSPEDWAARGVKK
jgi:hypothetical protein